MARISVDIGPWLFLLAVGLAAAYGEITLPVAFLLALTKLSLTVSRKPFPGESHD